MVYDIIQIDKEGFCMEFLQQPITDVKDGCFIVGCGVNG